MKKIMVCCGDGTAKKKLCDFLKESGFLSFCVSDVAQAKEMCTEADAALFVLLPEGSWEEGARAVACRRKAVAAIVPPAEKEHAESVLAGTGAAVLSFPLKPSVLAQTLRICLEMNMRLRELDYENERLKAELGDLKVIDRAKCALIQYLGMTEQEAHRFIEKQAMDTRSSRRDVAIKILKAYES